MGKWMMHQTHFSVWKDVRISWLLIHSLIRSPSCVTFYMEQQETGGMWYNIKLIHGRSCAAFLSEDYEDEQAERVRNRVQGEGESIRDFAYMYPSLCKHWKSDIIEEEIIKLISKNINPQLASQLRSSRVVTVD